MLCEICKKEEATVHLTKVADQQVKKLHLCEGCKEEMGVDTESPSSITDLFPGGNPDEPELTMEESVPASLVCPSCEMTKLHFKKSGRLGCVTCYETFEDELFPLIKAMHHSDRHTGKRPSRLSAKAVAQEELMRLQESLSLAIADEQFEEAARLRDEIRVCTKTLEESDGAEESAT